MKQASTVLLLIGIAALLGGVRATIFGDWLKHEDADKKSVKTIVILLASGEPLDANQEKQCQGHVLSVIPDTSAHSPTSCFIGCLPNGKGRAACCPSRSVFVPPTLSDPLGDCVSEGFSGLGAPLPPPSPPPMPPPPTPPPPSPPPPSPPPPSPPPPPANSSTIVDPPPPVTSPPPSPPPPPPTNRNCPLCFPPLPESVCGSFEDRLTLTDHGNNDCDFTLTTPTNSTIGKCDRIQKLFPQACGGYAGSLELVADNPSSLNDKYIQPDFQTHLNSAGLGNISYLGGALIVKTEVLPKNVTVTILPRLQCATSLIVQSSVANGNPPFLGRVSGLPLKNLTQLSGIMSMQNTAFTNLTDLAGLTCPPASIEVIGNPFLTNLTGLEKLQYMPSLSSVTIFANDALKGASAFLPLETPFTCQGGVVPVANTILNVDMDVCIGVLNVLHATSMTQFCTFLHKNGNPCPGTDTKSFQTASSSSQTPASPSIKLPSPSTAPAQQITGRRLLLESNLEG